MTMAEVVDGNDAEAWRDDAACFGVKPAVFVPDYSRVNDTVAYAFPRSVCGSCPVLEECLEYALSRGLNANADGMWGGTTPRERRRIIKQRKQAKGRRT